MKRKREHFIVDGYNVIHSWPELAALQQDLSEARDRLVHILSEYGAYEKYDITIVFDAFLTPDEEHQQSFGRHLTVIYTDEGETADSRIERLAYDSVRMGREVHVVTSDSTEQFVILGAGAYRIPSLEFRRSVRRAKKKIREEYLGKVTFPLARNEIGSRLDRETAAKLEQLRRNIRGPGDGQKKK